MDARLPKGGGDESIDGAGRVADGLDDIEEIIASKCPTHQQVSHQLFTSAYSIYMRLVIISGHWYYNVWRYLTLGTVEVIMRY